MPKWASEEHKQKAIAALTGKTLSEEHRRKVSETLKAKGIVPPSRLGEKLGTETREHVRQNSALMWANRTEEERREVGRRISKGRTGIPNPFKGGTLPYPGHPQTAETRRQISATMVARGINIGEDNPMWQGGASSFPYPLSFNNKLKEEIRDRDGRRCRICRVAEEELPRRLFVHHVDRDKNNNDRSNLASTCPPCSGKMHGKEAWGKTTEEAKRLLLGLKWIREEVGN